MPNRTLSDLPVETTVAGTDIIHMRKSLTDKSITQTKIAEFVQNNSSYSPTVVNVTGTSHVISTTIRKQVLLCNVSSTCTLTFPGSYGDAKEIVIINDAASTANIIGLPNSEVLFPGQEVVFFWDGSAFAKREFNTRFLESTASPSITPNYAGQVFVDSTNNRIWVSTGSSSSADWTELADQVVNVSSITSDYTITTTDGYNNIDFAHSTTTAKIEATLPSVSANTGRIIRLTNVGTTNGLSYVTGDSTNILWNDEVKATVKLFMRGDYVLVRSNGTYWIVEDYNINIHIGWQNRSDWTNVHMGNAFTYDSKSAGVDLTGEKITDGTTSQTAIILYDSGGTGTSGTHYIYGIDNIGTGNGTWADGNLITAGGGTTCNVNEGTGDSKNIDYISYHGVGVNIEDYQVNLYISTDGTSTNSFQIPFHTNTDSGSSFGITPHNVDSNSWKCQTSGNGFQYISDAGAATLVQTSDIYYNFTMIF